MKVQTEENSYVTQENVLVVDYLLPKDLHGSQNDLFSPRSCFTSEKTVTSKDFTVQQITNIWTIYELSIQTIRFSNK